MIDVPMPQFEAAVAIALDALPPELGELMQNCVVVVEDDVPPGSPRLLGLYEGIPLTERGDHYSAVLPDRITIYRRPILAMCRDVGEVAEEILVTVTHEVAHHFGIDDARLHELGWG